MVDLHPHVARERVGTQIDDRHATMFQSFNARETFFFFSHWETSLFATLESLIYKCRHANSLEIMKTHRQNILLVMPSSSCCMLRPHPVKCRTSQCTTVQLSWLSSQVQQTTPDHTQPFRWVWSVMEQTWTFQPIEVSATILTPYKV